MGWLALAAGSLPAFGVATPAVVANQNSSLVLAANNTVCSVGRNNSGQLGDGTAVNRAVRVTDSYLNGAVSISVGYNHGLAAKSDGTVWAWGLNADNQLGTANFNRLTPYPVAGLTGFVAVNAGAYHSLALRNDGTVWAWGGNEYGQVGDGSRTSAGRPAPAQVVNLTNVKAILATFRTSYAIKSDGTLWAWGDNTANQYGSGTSNVGVTSPVQIYNGFGVSAMAATGQNLLVLRTDGQVWGWGANGTGQLGNGTNLNATTPVRAGTLSGIKAIASGDTHSLAVDSAGNVWSWGQNTNGQLGDGSTGRNVPALVSGLSGVDLVAASTAASCAQKADGSLFTWGDNTFGQLGVNSTARQPTPTAAQACVGYPIAPGPAISSNTLRLSTNRSSSLALTQRQHCLRLGRKQRRSIRRWHRHQPRYAGRGLCRHQCHFRQRRFLRWTRLPNRWHRFHLGYKPRRSAGRHRCNRRSLLCHHRS